ncbi:MAG: hypothetical protein ALAOOOJD_04586 [bacterium]|nr:hypothetical protein [bacterium]
MPAEESKKTLTVAQKCDLLQFARQTIAAHIANLPLPRLRGDWQELAHVHAGVFVSLHIGERLRGCIGYVESGRALPEALGETAIAAASRDPRFEPVTADELAQVEIEISILSPLRAAASPAEIILGRHGVMVRLGPQQGLLLPQVSLRHDWDSETFLAHVCQKAGLSADAWKDSDAAILIFEAEVFSEGNFA